MRSSSAIFASASVSRCASVSGAVNSFTGFGGVTVTCRPPMLGEVLVCTVKLRLCPIFLLSTGITPLCRNPVYRSSAPQSCEIGYCVKTRLIKSVGSRPGSSTGARTHSPPSFLMYSSYVYGNPTGFAASSCTHLICQAPGARTKYNQQHKASTAAPAPSILYFEQSAPQSSPTAATRIAISSCSNDSICCQHKKTLRKPYVY